VNVVFENLDSNLFPGIDSSIEAHSGFVDEQAKTAADILAAVQSWTFNSWYQLCDHRWTFSWCCHLAHR